MFQYLQIRIFFTHSFLFLFPFPFLQMYIALISGHALGLSGVHFFTCIKVQWNGKNHLCTNCTMTVTIKQKVREIST